MTSAGTSAAGALLDVVPDDLVADAELVGEADADDDAEPDAEAVLAGADDEVSVDADCPVQAATSTAANPRVATVRSARICIHGM